MEVYLLCDNKCQIGKNQSESEVLECKCSVESGLGVVVQSLSLVVSLSNEAPWSRGSHPSLGPHTSLMFPHHSPDNYRGRECHLSRASSTEGDSTRSVVCQTGHECVASLTHTHSGSIHTLANKNDFTQSEPYCMCPLIPLATHGMLDSFWLCSSRLLSFSSSLLRISYVSKQKVCIETKDLFT